jgi:nitroimidazol reductase NimA-like FMN-containing flavoprotein (pyridoxamine 5'-phosphate oxidase superfamily)
MSYSMTKPEREAFLADLHVGILSVAAPGRGPVSVPVWYDYVPGGELFFCSPRNARKVDLIRAAGRFSLCAVVEPVPSRYVSVEGAVTAIEACDFERHQRVIARRYLGLDGGDAYTEAVRAGEAMVTIRMRPERWSSADYRKQPDPGSNLEGSAA